MFSFFFCIYFFLVGEIYFFFTTYLVFSSLLLMVIVENSCLLEDIFLGAQQLTAYFFQGFLCTGFQINFTISQNTYLSWSSPSLCWQKPSRRGVKNNFSKSSPFRKYLYLYLIKNLARESQLQNNSPQNTKGFVLLSCNIHLENEKSDASVSVIPWP